MSNEKLIVLIVEDNTYIGKYWVGKYMYIFYHLTIVRLLSCFSPFVLG